MVFNCQLSYFISDISQELCWSGHRVPYSNDWVPLERRLTRGCIRKETLADYFAEHVFMKDREDVFMELVKVKQYGWNLGFNILEHYQIWKCHSLVSPKFVLNKLLLIVFWYWFIWYESFLCVPEFLRRKKIMFEFRVKHFSGVCNFLVLYYTEKFGLL